jgi:hypothetical protein
MKRELNFVSREYGWGWSVWIEVNGSKTLLVDKLDSEFEVNDFINNLPNLPLIKDNISY